MDELKTYIEIEKIPERLIKQPDRSLYDGMMVEKPEKKPLNDTISVKSILGGDLVIQKAQNGKGDRVYFVQMRYNDEETGKVESESTVSISKENLALLGNWIKEQVG